ncbi:unnamed protein product [Symbiodinium necroappetens]|uniref:Uncharacterized protein n=1 Tax=Symbiodinium necroappetens TaxID=1628268 RepID=A0A812RHV8_9DINO|nr:unnamed protein product [Symbiodinium necroappetens]
MPVPSTTTKADKFRNLQLRSMLDEPEAQLHDTWAKMLESGLCQGFADVGIQLSLPSSAEAEELLLHGVERLAEALPAGKSGAAFAAFYKSFGWENPAEYFAAMGEHQVMLVDVDHNDSDDRLAVMLLACQVASANAERRISAPSATCKVYLDCRTYEHSGLTLWRTVQLAARIGAVTVQHGVEVVPVVSEPAAALELMAAYLKVANLFESLNGAAAGAGDTLRSAAQDLRGLEVSAGRPVTVWILSGLCRAQVDDFDFAQKKLGVVFTFVEQAQPAWQSVKLPSEEKSEIQPPYEFPPPTGDESGFGVEPSNIRSSEASYRDTLLNYVRFQRTISGNGVPMQYVCPALARNDGFMPVQPGNTMHKVSGRPFNVIPGKSYVIKKARDPNRAQHAFVNLLSACKAHAAGSLHDELCIDSTDDFGADRPELAAVVKYGTFMADAILVCLAARPKRMMKSQEALRRLAVMLVPKPGD